MAKTQYRMQTKYETINGAEWGSTKWYDTMEELNQNHYYNEEYCRIITRETEIITPEFIRAQIQAKFERNQREILDV